MFYAKVHTHTPIHACVYFAYKHQKIIYPLVVLWFTSNPPYRILLQGNEYVPIYSLGLLSISILLTKYMVLYCTIL